MIRGLRLGPDHDLTPLIEWIDDDVDAATVQEIKTRALLWRGENFLDLREGVPYKTEILRKAPNLARIQEIFRQVILSVPSILDVPDIRASLDHSTRELTIDWTARLRSGIEIHSSDFGPLIIALD